MKKIACSRLKLIPTFNFTIPTLIVKRTRIYDLVDESQSKICVVKMWVLCNLLLVVYLLLLLLLPRTALGAC